MFEQVKSVKGAKKMVQEIHNQEWVKNQLNDYDMSWKVQYDADANRFQFAEYNSNASEEFEANCIDGKDVYPVVGIYPITVSMARLINRSNAIRKALNEGQDPAKHKPESSRKQHYIRLFFKLNGLTL